MLTGRLRTVFLLSLAQWIALPGARGENVTVTFRNYPPTYFEGPFELRDAYPAYFYYGNTDWSNHTTWVKSKTAMKMNEDTTGLWRSANDSLPVYCKYFFPTHYK
jgi:hypothetical protein